MVRCKKCNSINIKVLDLNFAKRKNEGQPSAKAEDPKKEFYCYGCGDSWFSDPEAEKLYFEYKDLVPRTQMVAQTIKRGEPYKINYIKPHELSRRIEIAKILKEKHQHDLELEAGEWFRIFQDAI